MPMSTLQIGLMVLGGLLLLVMAAHAVWTARKNRPRQATPEEGATPGGSEAALGAGIEPGLDMAAFDVVNFPLPTPEKRPTMDALIDVIAPIALETPVSGDAALAAMPDSSGEMSSVAISATTPAMLKAATFLPCAAIRSANTVMSSCLAISAECTE